MTFPNGNIYKGAWLDKRPHGSGTMTYKSTFDSRGSSKGSQGFSDENDTQTMRYEGEWLKGMRHGQGVLLCFFGGDENWRYTG